jgi:hypothetical protein
MTDDHHDHASGGMIIMMARGSPGPSAAVALSTVTPGPGRPAGWQCRPARPPALQVQGLDGARPGPAPAGPDSGTGPVPGVESKPGSSVETVRRDVMVTVSVTVVTPGGHHLNRGRPPAGGFDGYQSPPLTKKNDRGLVIQS